MPFFKVFKKAFKKLKHYTKYEKSSRQDKSWFVYRISAVTFFIVCFYYLMAPYVDRKKFPPFLFRVTYAVSIKIMFLTLVNKFLNFGKCVPHT